MRREAAGWAQHERELDLVTCLLCAGLLTCATTCCMLTSHPTIVGTARHGDRGGVPGDPPLRRLLGRHGGVLQVRTVLRCAVLCCACFGDVQQCVCHHTAARTRAECGPTLAARLQCSTDAAALASPTNSPHHHWLARRWEGITFDAKRGLLYTAMSDIRCAAAGLLLLDCCCRDV